MARSATMIVMSLMVAMEVAVVVVVVGQTPSTWKHGNDDAVCTRQANSPGNNLPNLPDSFSLRVEANLLYKNRTTTLHEFYDYGTNKAAVRQIENGMESYYFYLDSSNQLLTATPDGGGGYLCSTQNLANNVNSAMFGLKVQNSTMDRIYSVYGALHFGDGIYEQFLGTETVRGIPCNKWQSCQYWSELDSTSTVVWYFAQKNWNTISGYTAPVRCHVTGVRWVNQSYSYPFEHIYEFYDFQTDIAQSDNHFEVPSNTFCFQETNTKPLPTMPRAYSFNAENFNVITNSIGFVREEYDKLSSVMRYDYRDPPTPTSPLNTVLMSQIHDFNTGVAYVIDVLRANCTTGMIATFEFDDVTNGGTVKLRDPNQFMGLDHNYIYQGVRTTRGVECDTWAALRFDYPDPSINNPSTTWTWYFATVDWMRAMGFRDNFVLPVMLEIFNDDPSNPVHKQMSFYEYNAEEPDVMSWDLSPCYDVSHSRNYAFLVQGRFRDIVGNSVKLFKYDIVLSVQAVTGISPLRVAHLDVQEAGENVLVTFDMLDKAPLKGDVAHPPSEPSLDNAFNTLTSKVNHGDFKVIRTARNGSPTRQIRTYPAGPQYQVQSASRKRRSASPYPSQSSSGFTSGAMGGMAVGMLLLGALLGFGAMFVVYKLKGGTFHAGFGMKRFQNDDQQDSVDTKTEG